MKTKFIKILKNFKGFIIWNLDSVYVEHENICLAKTGKVILRLNDIVSVEQGDVCYIVYTNDEAYDVYLLTSVYVRDLDLSDETYVRTFQSYLESHPNFIINDRYPGYISVNSEIMQMFWNTTEVLGTIDDISEIKLIDRDIAKFDVKLKRGCGFTVTLTDKNNLIKTLFA